MKSERTHINLVGGGSSSSPSKSKRRKAKGRVGGRKRRLTASKVATRKRARSPR